MKRAILTSLVLFILSVFPLASFSQTTGTFTDSRDGRTYKTVKIGNQVWMAENLAYLPQVSNTASRSDSNSHYYIYGYEVANVNVAKEMDHYQTYGVLYNWPAAISSCPSGWHLPSDEEWKELEMYLGMSQSEADDEGWRGTDEGGKLKKTGKTHWRNPNEGATNESGFSALPGGCLFIDGDFDVQGYSRGYWWTSTESFSTHAWSRSMTFHNSLIYRKYVRKENGRSVRCLRD